MTFTPFINYAGYEHVLEGGACFIHPGNGTPYFAVCEKQGGSHQNLSVYRWRNNAMELVKRYYGTVDSEGPITMGGAAIAPDGAMWVATSLIIPGAATATKTGFQGSFLREPNIDTPYTTLDTLEARIRALEWFFAIPGKLRIGPENATGAGGEIMFIGSKGETWSIDTTNGELRFFLNGPAGKWSMKLGG